MKYVFLPKKPYTIDKLVKGVNQAPYLKCNAFYNIKKVKKEDLLNPKFGDRLEESDEEVNETVDILNFAPGLFIEEPEYKELSGGILSANTTELFK